MERNISDREGSNGKRKEVEDIELLLDMIYLE